jgi:hypothetical protein
MDEIIVEYLCPECDTLLTYGSRLCPGCGAIVDWLETREVPGGAVADAHGAGAPVGAIEGVVMASSEEVVAGEPATPQMEGATAISRALTASGAHPDTQPAEDTTQTGAEEGTDIPAAATPVAPQSQPEAAPAPEAPIAVPAAGDGAPAIGVGVVPPDDAAPSHKSLYMGVFSRRGAVAYSVMALSALGTVLVLNWDTMFGGAGAETIGRMQLAAVSAGIALTVVAGAVGVWDAYHAARAAGRESDRVEQSLIQTEGAN